MIFKTSKKHKRFIKKSKNIKQKAGKVRSNLFKDEKFNVILNEINDTMLHYNVRNYDFHSADDVSDHSIWSAMIAKEWFNDSHGWIHGILSNYKEITIFAAFLHDIGKVGDGDYVSLIEPGWKLKHPDDGFEFLLGNKSFITSSIDKEEVKKGWYKNNEIWVSPLKRSKELNLGINLKEYLFENNFTEEEWAILAMSVVMHYDFGDIIVLDKKHGDNKYKVYLDKFYEKLEIVKNQMINSIDINVEQILRICILVSAADVRGSNPVDFTGFGDLKEPFTKFPSPDEPNYDKFKYDNNLEHRDKLLELFIEQTKIK